MKKKFIIALCMLMLLFSNPSRAEWVEGYDSKKEIGAWYVDDDVNDEENYCTMWTKIVYRTPQKAANGKKYFIEFLQVAFPLRTNNGVKRVNTKKIASIVNALYDGEKNEVYSEDRTGRPIKWYSVVPESYGAEMAKYAAEFYNAKYNCK